MELQIINYKLGIYLQLILGRRGGHWPSAEGAIIVGSYSDEQHPFGGLSCPCGAIYILLAPTVLDGGYSVGVGNGVLDGPFAAAAIQWAHPWPIL